MQLPEAGKPNMEISLPEADHGYIQPGPPDLARDAGWLALAVLRKDIVINQSWIDALTPLYEEGTASINKKMPEDHPKVIAIHGARVALYGQLGWIEDDLFHGKLLGQEITDRPPNDILPSTRRAWAVMRLLDFYVGKELLRPVQNCYNLLYCNPFTFPYLLADAARDYGVDVPDLLLNHPDVATKESTPRRLAKVLRTRIRESGNAQTRARRGIDRQTEIPVNLQALIGNFTDGLELSASERDFLTAGPLTLERDTGWLEIASLRPDTKVDEAWITKLNIFYEAGLKVELGQDRSGDEARAARWGLLQELGWTDEEFPLAKLVLSVHKNGKLIPTDTFVSVMRLYYAFLGNDLMIPISWRINMAFCAQQNILDRMTQITSDEEDALWFLRNHPDAFLVNKSKPLDYALIKKRWAKRESRAITPRPAPSGEKKPRSRKRAQKTPDTESAQAAQPELSPEATADPREQEWAETLEAYEATTPERRAAIQDIANNVVGGRDMLLKLAPSIVYCSQDDLKKASDIAEEFMGTRQAARKIGVFLALKYPDPTT